MGNPIGFKLHSRKEQKRQTVTKRLKNFKEFEETFSKDSAVVEASRCMDCGIPFCHGDTGCPVDNYIPEWNELVYKGNWKEAIDNLHSTNNFPEFTGRLCPAPCESACVLGIDNSPVSIKALERSIIDIAFEKGYVTPKPPRELNSKSVAIVGSGPAGLACAQQLARKGFKVCVFEKNARVGGLLRFGIPDFKMEKSLIDQRIKQMESEGVKFKTGIHIGKDLHLTDLQSSFDYIVLAGGCEQPRDLPIKGRDAKGVHFAMDFLRQQNDIVAGVNVLDHISAKGKDVVVIGGGDTGSDCIGTSNRQGATFVHQLEIFSKPPEKRADSTPWPFWPMKLRTSSSHEEGTERLWSVNTKEFLKDSSGVVRALLCEKVILENGKFKSIPKSEFEIKADLVFLGMGFVHPPKDSFLDQLIKVGIDLDKRGNIQATYGREKSAHQTAVDNIFVCGDMRRGQSLIVWAIAEGRHCAEAILVDFSKKKNEGRRLL